jgi:ubiquinone/menaquinone biosynthesis C-methylase UbiE
MIPATSSGSRAAQAKLWGARAEDWASQDDTNKPLYESALERLRLRTGDRLLDIGCGTGYFCGLAQEKGATAVGLDATPEFIQIAKERYPNCTFDEGEMETLPYRNAEFDFVTAFNAFQFAANPLTAIYEAKRVTKVGALVLIATWGRMEQCQASAFFKALATLVPPPPGAAGPFALSEPGALESLVQQVRLDPEDSSEVEVVWNFPDEATALKRLLAAGPASRVINEVGEEKVRAAAIEVLTPFRTADGSYRITNVFRYLVSST